MEPPPRLYHYVGLFTSVRSIDLSLKLIFLVCILVVLILVAAWYLSWKTYKRAPKDDRYSFSRVKNLLDFNLHSLISSHQWDQLCPSATTGVLCGKTTLFVNDWQLMDSYEWDCNLDNYFSQAPTPLRRAWYGLLLSDSSLSNRSDLRAILLHTFDTLLPHAYTTFASSDLDDEPEQNLDIRLYLLLSNFLIFNSAEYIGDRLTMQQMKLDFLKRIKPILHCLESYYFYGNLKNVCRAEKCSSVAQFLKKIEYAFIPLIQYTTEYSLTATSHESGHHISYTSTTLLSQLVRAHNRLEVEGEYVSFLSMKHLTHSMAEIFFILYHTLLRHTRLLSLILTVRPRWYRRLSEEVTNFAVVNEHGENVFCPSAISLQQLDMLVWTKAIVLETMRFSILGWPFGTIRRAIRDGRMHEFEYAENDLVLFNQAQYMFDPRLWNSEESIGYTVEKPYHMCFNPHRFLTNETSERLNLPMHWVRFVLHGYNVVIPNESVYLLLIGILLHPEGYQSITDNLNKFYDSSDEPIWFNSDNIIEQ